MDSQEKKLAYMVMMKRAPKPLQLIASGSVFTLFVGIGVGALKDPWMGFSIVSAAWYMKGWSFKKMAEETGQICSECGGAVFR